MLQHLSDDRLRYDRPLWCRRLSGSRRKRLQLRSLLYHWAQKLARYAKHNLCLTQQLCLPSCGYCKACSIDSLLTWLCLQDQLRTALAIGADKGIHVLSDAPDLQPLAVAKVLAAVAKQQQPSLFFLGKQAIDDDCSQTGECDGTTVPLCPYCRLGCSAQPHQSQLCQAECQSFRADSELLGLGLRQPLDAKIVLHPERLLVYAEQLMQSAGLARS